MGSKVEYVESSQIYTTNYIRNSKAIGVLWGIFTICYAIINVVAFVTPEWIGDTQESNYPGRFGLWTYCFFLTENGIEDCQGRLDDFSTIPNPAFRAATVFVGLSVIITLLCICCMLLFFFFQSTTVFHICGWMQVFSAVCMTVGVAAYPAGWDASQVRQTCGSAAGRFELGECGIRWAYILAIIGLLDAIILSALAFILATRHVRLQAEPGYTGNGSIYKGEVNGAFIGDSQSLAGSRKSLNLHPVMLMPQPEPDRFSEFSNRTGRSKSSAYRAEYASSIQNFQL